MMRLCLLTCLSMFLSTFAKSQSNGGASIIGTVIDSTNGKAVYNATVSLLLASDSSLVKFSITDGDGNFTFRKVAKGKYRLLITHLSYQNISALIDVQSETTELGVLKAAQQTIGLGEVVVEQEKAPVTLKADTLEFNANAFKSKQNAQVEDLLKKLPGIEVNRDGTVKAQGQEVKKILVDGKPFFGDDPKMATRNLPAEIIDKVQVYDQQSDQSSFSGFDDGNREKTINLVTRRDKRKGLFGQNHLGVGSNARYNGRLNVNRFNNGQQISLLGLGNNVNQQGFTMQDMLSFGSANATNQGNNGNSNSTGGTQTGGDANGSSMRTKGNSGNQGNEYDNNITETLAGGINYRDAWGKKTEVSSSYFVNRSGIDTRQKSHRNYILPDTSYLFDENNESHNQGYFQRFNVRLDYQIDTFTSVSWSSGLLHQSGSFNSLRDSRTYSNAYDQLNQSRAEIDAQGNGVNANNNLLFKRKFNKKGRTFSLNLKSILTYQDKNEVNKSSNIFYVPNDSSSLLQTLNQQNQQTTNTFTNTVSASYTEPLSLRKSLEWHFIYGQSKNESEKSVNDYNESTAKYDEQNDLLSNQFENVFTVKRLGIGVQTRRLKYSYTLGLDFQSSNMQTNNKSSDDLINNNYHHFLPSAQFTYNLSRNRMLKVNYRTSINPPSVSQLQPVKDYSNPLNIFQGNPNLQPEYVHNVTAIFNSFNSANFRSVFAALNLSGTENKIVNDLQFNQEGVQETKLTNRDGVYSANGFLAFGYSLNILNQKLNLNLNTNLSYNRGINMINQKENISQSYVIGQGISLNSNFSTKFEMNLTSSINYRHAEYSLQQTQNADFLKQTLSMDIDYDLPFQMVFITNLNYNKNFGQSTGYNQQYILWNLTLGRKFFKNKQGELRVGVYDLLNQNRSVTRNVADTYVEDIESKVLKRYFMLTFSYQLRKFTNTTRP
jgi:hypothetical protein